MNIKTVDGVPFRLSNQAVGALMLALQKGIMEKCDITDLIKDFRLTESADGLVVENPPHINMEEEDDVVA